MAELQDFFNFASILFIGVYFFIFWMIMLERENFKERIFLFLIAGFFLLCLWGGLFWSLYPDINESKRAEDLTIPAQELSESELIRRERYLEEEKQQKEDHLKRLERVEKLEKEKSQ